MLINCPKCGFSQPQDRYCASCGVDISMFRPKPLPAWKKMVLHPAFYMTSLVVVLGGAYALIKQNHRRELEQRVQFLRSGPVIIQQKVQQDPQAASENFLEEESSSQDSEENIAADSMDDSATQAPPAPTIQPYAAGMANAANSNSPNGSAAADVDARKNSETILNIRVGFYPKSNRQLLTAEMRRAGNIQRFEEAMWGAIPADSLAKLDVQSVSQVQRKLGSANPSQTWFLGHRNAESQDADMGLGFYIALGEPEGENLKAEFELLRSFREVVGGALNRKSYPVYVELGPQENFVVADFLPRKVEMSSEEELGPDGNMVDLFKIFRNPAYSRGQMESILILEFNRSL